MSDAPRIIGRYALYGKIASGGMATVHLGRLLGPVGFSRTVAIKRMHPHFTEDPEFVSMFLDEARLAARIRHPNVVPTLDVVATDGELFLVMEYVQGETIARLLRLTGAQQRKIPLPIVGAIFSGVLHGLHAAHEAKNERGEPLGIVHRDVSPQNVIVGIDGVPRVLDFGVAKAAGRLQTTREGQLKGKISYMAPEQVRGTQATRQTDIYAVAVVLWETLTGRRLFQDDNDAAVLQRVLDGQVPPPSFFVPGLPAAFDALVLRGLNRDAARRFGTAREMAASIEAVLPLAIPVQVGEWVESAAGPNLASQAAKVAEIESASDASIYQAPEATHVAQSSAPPPPRPPVRSFAASPSVLLNAPSAPARASALASAPAPKLAPAPALAPASALAPPEAPNPAPDFPTDQTLVAEHAPMVEVTSETGGVSQMSSISVSTPGSTTPPPELTQDRRKMLRRIVGGVVAASALIGLTALIVRVSHGTPASDVAAAATAPAEPVTSTAATPSPPVPSLPPVAAPVATAAPLVSSAPSKASVATAATATHPTSAPPAQTQTPRPAVPSPPPQPQARPQPAVPRANPTPAAAPSSHPKSNILFTNPG